MGSLSVKTTFGAKWALAIVFGFVFLIVLGVLPYAFR